MNSNEQLSEKIDSVIALYSDGKIEDAIDEIKLLNEDYPNEPILFNIIGACYSSLGKTNNAAQSYEKAISLKPDYIDAIYNYGNTLRDLNRLEESLSAFEQVIALSPYHEGALHNLGASLQELNRINDAIDHYLQAKITSPNNIDIIINLGFIYQNLGQFDNAIHEYENALKIDSNNPMTINNIGACYREIGDSNKAVEYFKKLLEIDSSHINSHYNLGFIYQDLGMVDNAITHYQQAIDINNHAMSFHNISHLKGYDSNHKDIIKMRSFLSHESLDIEDQIHINLGLANVNEKLGNKIEFFKYLNAGNRLQKENLNYSLDIPIKEHLALKELFIDPTKFESSNNIISESIKCPIFIVGMPRSGTSLVEQILASHNEVYGAGELNTLTKLVKPVIKNFISGDIFELTSQTNLFIRDEYINMLENLQTNQNIITDKLPLNFQYIGFILSAIPEAKIIHIERDARAICWSNYKYYFKSKSNGYSNNFDDLSGFYGLYFELMKFWHKAYPKKIYDLNYEKLTINQETETRNLLNFCDLKWDANCLKFNENDRAVKTISALQVRQKMYQGSSDAWKKYWSHIQPLISALEKY